MNSNSWLHHVAQHVVVDASRGQRESARARLNLDAGGALSDRCQMGRNKNAAQSQQGEVVVGWARRLLLRQIGKLGVGQVDAMQPSPFGTQGAQDRISAVKEFALA